MNNIHYHSGVWNKGVAKSLSFWFVIGIATVALGVSVLALKHFHMTPDWLKDYSPAGAYFTLGGGVISLGIGSALIGETLYKQYKFKRKANDKYLAAVQNYERKTCTSNEKTQKTYLLSEKKISLVAINNGTSFEHHIYSEQEKHRFTKISQKLEKSTEYKNVTQEYQSYLK